MKIDYAHMGFLSVAEGINFDSPSLANLADAVDISSIQTFGWPIAAVLRFPDCKPMPVSNGMELRINEPDHRDYWCVKRNSEFFFLGELFENSRRPEKVFLDTRINRICEVFMRVARYYRTLLVPEQTLIRISLWHGNISGRLLGVASQRRVMARQKICGVNQIDSEFCETLSILDDTQTLKKNVYLAARSLLEMFDGFDLQQSISDEIVDDFIRGRIS
jgi:hypothetical protein